jgi:RND family efflux transporter MFP subunit
MGLALVAGLVLSACHRSPAPASEPALPVAAVEVQTVGSRAFAATEEVVGTVRARLRASIEAKVSGRIQALRVAPGQRVEAGELLAQLDAAEIRARLDQAQALRQLAERDLKRFAELRQQQAVTQQEYDAVEARHRVAQASVAEAEAMLGYTLIVAPFAGVVTRKLAEVGDLAGPGRPLLELEDPARLRLEADVPEALLSKVRLGAAMDVRVASMDARIEGVVGEIAPAADPNTRTFRVKLDLPPAAGLMPGQFGRVAVPVGERSALRVPAASVVRRGQMELVFVVAGGRAELRLVKTGRALDQECELVSGVEAGEAVVVKGAAGLVDGQPVRVP